MSASDLMRLVRELNAPYGLERSVKIVHGALLNDRFLVSLHRAAFGADVADKLLQMGRKLNAPEAVIEAITAAQAEADIVHFGYEGGAHAVYKLYLEYAAKVRRAQAQNADEPSLVHLAFKWTPGGRHAVTRYTWLPCRTHVAIAERLRVLVSPAEASRALSCGLKVLARAGERAEAHKLFLMEVEEPGNPRRSYDINVYQAELRLRDCADVIAACGTEFAVPQQEVKALLAGSGALDLGHLAGGRGRDGSEFVTIYYGVEAH